MIHKHDKILKAGCHTDYGNETCCGARQQKSVQWPYHVTANSHGFFHVHLLQQLAHVKKSHQADRTFRLAFRVSAAHVDDNQGFQARTSENLPAHTKRRLASPRYYTCPPVSPRISSPRRPHPPSLELPSPFRRPRPRARAPAAPEAHTAKAAGPPGRHPWRLAYERQALQTPHHAVYRRAPEP